MQPPLLTPLELKVMNLLWPLKKALVKDLIERWPDEPKPKYNTVSTMVRILEEKGYVGHEPQGRSHLYFPLVNKSTYQKRLLKSVINQAFSGSLTGMVSTLLKNEPMSEQELDELRAIIDQSSEEA